MALVLVFRGLVHVNEDTGSLSPMQSEGRRQLEGIAAVTARDRTLIAAHHKGDAHMVEIPDKVVALLDVVRALDSIKVSYALVGGIAVGIHSGVPRATMYPPCTPAPGPMSMR